MKISYLEYLNKSLLQGRSSLKLIFQSVCFDYQNHFLLPKWTKNRQKMTVPRPQKIENQLASRQVKQLIF